MLEKGIAPGEKKDVPGAPHQRLQQYFSLIYTDPDRLHDAATAQLLEGAIAAAAERPRDRGMPFPTMLHRPNVVDVKDVNPRYYLVA